MHGRLCRRQICMRCVRARKRGTTIRFSTSNSAPVPYSHAASLVVNWLISIYIRPIYIDIYINKKLNGSNCCIYTSMSQNLWALHCFNFHKQCCLFCERNQRTHIQTNVNVVPTDKVHLYGNIFSLSIGLLSSIPLYVYIYIQRILPSSRPPPRRWYSWPAHCYTTRSSMAIYRAH